MMKIDDYMSSDYRDRAFNAFDFAYGLMFRGVEGDIAVSVAVERYNVYRKDVAIFFKDLSHDISDSEKLQLNRILDHRL